jgi:hypothetical protein
MFSTVIRNQAAREVIDSLSLVGRTILHYRIIEKLGAATALQEKSFLQTPVGHCKKSAT